MNRLIAQARKELTQLRRDRLALALALLLPLIQLTLMGNSFALIVRDLPIIVQDFAEDTRRLQPRHGRKVDRCFGVTGTTQDATIFCT